VGVKRGRCASSFFKVLLFEVGVDETTTTSITTITKTETKAKSS
jgi:hypothetical protein